MAQLQHIKPSLSELDPISRMAIHKSIRSSRMVSKASPTKAAAKRKEDRREVMKTFKAMTPEQAVELLKLLQKD